MQVFLLRTERAKAAAIECIRRVPLDKFEARIVEFHARRTLDQNARYWAILAVIAAQVLDENARRYSPETWHEFFKALLLGKNTMIVDGQPVLVAKTTTRLNKVTFAEYMTRVEVWAVEHGVNFGW